VLAVMAVVATTWAASPARAQTEPRRLIGILDIRVEGMPRTAAKDLETELESTASPVRERFWIGSRDRMREMLAGSTTWTEGCLLGPCMTEVRMQTHADLVLTVFLQGLGTTYRHVITLIRTDTGGVVDQRTDTCVACAQSEAITKATSAILEMVGNTPDLDKTGPIDPARMQRELVTPLRESLASARRRTRITGGVLLAAAVVGAGVGFYLYSSDRGGATPVLAASAGLAASGAVVLGMSFAWD
jgi:hypothetical protein